MLNTDLYSVDFFDLQLRFAAKVAELSGLPFTETVGSHTNIYVRLSMGPRLDHTNPDWLEYVSALATARNPTAWTYEVHRRRAHLPTGPEVAASVGCFSYAHFGPKPRSSSLSRWVSAFGITTFNCEREFAQKGTHHASFTSCDVGQRRTGGRGFLAVQLEFVSSPVSRAVSF